MNIIHSGQKWASPGRVTGEFPQRHVCPCGCTTEGDGTPGNPIRIIYCVTHDQAHKTKQVLSDLLNVIPSSEFGSRLETAEANARNHYASICSNQWTSSGKNHIAFLCLKKDESE